MQIPDLPLLQDASTPVSQQTTISVTPDVAIPMLQDSTIPRTIPDTATYNVVAAANQAPGFGRGMLIARASPMQMGTPVVSLQRTPMHGVTAEEVLLQGATPLCFPHQEANLLNPPLMLKENHIKMMDALCHLDTTGLQFICEPVEALCRERTPVQALPGAVHCRCQTLYGGKPPTPPCHKSSTVPPAISVQPSLCLNKLYHSSISPGITIQILKL